MQWHFPQQLSSRKECAKEEEEETKYQKHRLVNKFTKYHRIEGKCCRLWWRIIRQNKRFGKRSKVGEWSKAANFNSNEWMNCRTQTKRSNRCLKWTDTGFGRPFECWVNIAKYCGTIRSNTIYSVISFDCSVAQAYINQKRLDAEAKQLHISATNFAKQTQQWMNLIEGFSSALKVLCNPIPSSIACRVHRNELIYCRKLAMWKTGRPASRTTWLKSMKHWIWPTNRRRSIPRSHFDRI